MDDIKFYFPPATPEQLSKLQLTVEGKYSITKPPQGKQIIDIIKTYIPNSHSYNFVDGTAGMGGDMYYVAPLFNKAIGVEKNSEHAKIASSNLEVLGVKTTIYNQSVLDYLDHAYQKDFPDGIDVLWIDPPWGGPDYKKYKELDLFLDGKNIGEYVSQWLDKRIAKVIIIKAPYNYNVGTISALKYKYLKFEIFSKKGVQFILLLIW